MAYKIAKNNKNDSPNKMPICFIFCNFYSHIQMCLNQEATFLLMSYICVVGGELENDGPGVVVDPVLTFQLSEIALSSISGKK